LRLGRDRGDRQHAKAQTQAQAQNDRPQTTHLHARIANTTPTAPGPAL
jgi:hypothetical protein